MVRHLGKIFVLWVYLAYFLINCCAQLFTNGVNNFPGQTSFKKINVSVRLSRSYENQRQVSIKKAPVHLPKVKSNSLNTCFNYFCLNFKVLAVKTIDNAFSFHNSYKTPVYLDNCNFRI
jgi:hypothetical protein